MKTTLNYIHNYAMLAEHNSLEIGYDIKYEWQLWEYLEVLLDIGMISGAEYLKIKGHYRKYFKELRIFMLSRN